MRPGASDKRQGAFSRQFASAQTAEEMLTLHTRSTSQHRSLFVNVCTIVHFVAVMLSGA